MEKTKEVGGFKPYYEVREKIIRLNAAGKPIAIERKKEFPNKTLIGGRANAIFHCFKTFTSVMVSWRDGDVDYREILNVEDFDSWILTSGKYEFEIWLINGESETDHIRTWDSKYMGNINGFILVEAGLLDDLTKPLYLKTEVMS